MEAARACGLEPPKTYLSENLETYVVERFDKNHDGSYRIIIKSNILIER